MPRLDFGSLEKNTQDRIIASERLFKLSANYYRIIIKLTAMSSNCWPTQPFPIVLDS